MNNEIFNRNGFTVSELIKALQKFPQNGLVILSADEEGNDFGLLWSIEQDQNNVILWPASGTVEVES